MADVANGSADRNPQPGFLIYNAFGAAGFAYSNDDVSVKASFLLNNYNIT
jgi:hypothetical protein